jgi:hypothetical protein
MDNEFGWQSFSLEEMRMVDFTKLFRDTRHTAFGEKFNFTNNLLQNCAAKIAKFMT